MNLPKSLAITLTASTVATLAMFINWQPVEAATISTSFENSGDLPLNSADFTIGSSPASVSFMGTDTMTNTIGNPAFYKTGSASWMIGDGVIGGGTVGSIEFTSSANSVQFFAINGDNGQATINVFDSNNMLLETATVTATNMNDAAAEFNFSFADISLITIINPGPAGNPPYTTFVDDFSANVPVPEPSAVLGLLAVGGISQIRRSLAKK